jgi:hypothetical protein
MLTGKQARGKWQVANVWAEDLLTKVLPVCQEYRGDRIAQNIGRDQ